MGIYVVSAEAQHRAFRESLKAAMASQDPALLRKAIADFEKNKVADPKHMLDKAKKMLRFLTVSQGQYQSAMVSAIVPALYTDRYHCSDVTSAPTRGFTQPRISHFYAIE